MTVTTDLLVASIANGASLSDSVNLRAGRLFAIMMPADWTAASLTFQGSLDGTTFYNLYDEAGLEVAVQASDDRFIILEPARWLGVRYLKVRSGTSGSAVNQGGARTVNLVVVS